MDHFDLLTIHIFKDPRVLIPDYRVCKLSVRKHNGDLLLIKNFFYFKMRSKASAFHGMIGLCTIIGHSSSCSCDGRLINVFVALKKIPRQK